MPLCEDVNLWYNLPPAMPPTPEEKALLAEAPKGTYVLMIIAAALLLAGWAVLYLGRFLGHGPVR